jgi:hypothetical protein
VRDFEIVMERDSHTAFASFIYGLRKANLVSVNSPVDKLLYCFTNKSYRRNCISKDKQCVLQNIMITDEHYNAIYMWLFTLSYVAIEVYCLEIKNALKDTDEDFLKELDEVAINKAVGEIINKFNRNQF